MNKIKELFKNVNTGTFGTAVAWIFGMIGFIGSIILGGNSYFIGMWMVLIICLAGLFAGVYVANWTYVPDVEEKSKPDSGVFTRIQSSLVTLLEETGGHIISAGDRKKAAEALRRLREIDEKAFKRLVLEYEAYYDEDFPVEI